MKRQMNFTRMLAVAGVPLTLGMAPLAGWANGEFDEGEIFFELNNTDGDMGIHALIDGDAWKKLRIKDPNGKKMLDINVRGRLKKQGLTEIFFESAEPPFESEDQDEVALAPEAFFARFPEGDYRIRGKSLEGDVLNSETEVTHVMPGPPEVMLNDMMAAEDCDAELPVVGMGETVTIIWEPVTHSHPDLGISGVLIEVVNYEVVVEIDETPYRTSTILPPSATSFDVPPEILALNDEVKFEVLVREASYNQTAVESCFCIEACPEED